MKGKVLPISPEFQLIRVNFLNKLLHVDHNLFLPVIADTEPKPLPVLHPPWQCEVDSLCHVEPVVEASVVGIHSIYSNMHAQQLSWASLTNLPNLT